MIEQERQRRKEMWEELIAQGGPIDVSPHLLRELRIYGGYQGIWVDREKTEGLTNSSLGVTTGLLHTGVHYPDDLSETGIIYHYPQTNRPPSRDEGEIEATKAAYTLSLPVFVITKPFPNSTTRDVNLGWIEGWDDPPLRLPKRIPHALPLRLVSRPHPQPDVLALRLSASR